MTIELTTRSSHTENYSALEKILQGTQKDAETFLDVLRGVINHNDQENSHEEDSFRKLVSGKPDIVRTPRKFTEHLSGFVRIYCGWHQDDYVWHIEPAAIRRPWKVQIERVIYIISKIMHDILPDVEAKIWPPQSDWELKTVTFKALGLANEWSFQESDIERINSKLFSALLPLV